MLKLKSPLAMVFIAAVCFGFPPILTKQLFSSMSPAAILFFRFLFVIIIFPLVVIAAKRSTFRELISISKAEFRTFFALSLILLINMNLFFYSIYFIDVNKALFLFLTYPIVVLIMARIFLKEKISFTDIIAALISLFGIFLIFRSKIELSFSANKGELMMLASVILWSVYIVVNRHSGETTHHYRKTFWIFLFNFALLSPLFLLFGNPSSIAVLGFQQFLLLLALAVITLVPFALLSYTAKYVKPSTSSVILLLGPVIGILLSFVILKEKPPLNVLAGGLLVLMSAFISTYTVERIFSTSKLFAHKIRTILFGY